MGMSMRPKSTTNTEKLETLPFDVSDLHSILPYSSHGCREASPLDHIRWYPWWIHDQVKKEPKELFIALPDYDPDSNDSWKSTFVVVWKEIKQYMTENDVASIDKVVAHLVTSKLLKADTESDALSAARNLVFAIIGWQTMLYQADMHSCPPAQLAITDQMDGHQGRSYLRLKQNQSFCKKRIHELLLGFGVLLPPSNFNVPETPEEDAVFKEFKTAAPDTFNFHLLSSIGRITIKWVDSMACHLEFDQYSKTLFLFRYPSFCLAHLNGTNSELPHESVLHACAAPYGMPQWATSEEVTKMLQEIILSYRLLFGQNKASRQLFRKLKPFDGIPDEGTDTYLMALCGEKRCRTTYQRETYSLPRDFPILRSKIAVLLRHLSSKKPRTWTEVWQDKRDSASWLTLWAVIIIGGLGLFFAFLQVLLQIVQIILR